MASRRLSLFGRVPYVLKCIDLNKKKHWFGMVLWPRGVSAYLGGFLTCSNALIFMRKNIDLGWFCGLEASQPVWTGSWNALFLIRKSIDLKLLCNLEESQLVWEGSLSAQNALIWIRKSIDLGWLCGLAASQPIWEGCLSGQMHWFE